MVPLYRLWKGLKDIRQKKLDKTVLVAIGEKIKSVEQTVSPGAAPIQSHMKDG